MLRKESVWPSLMIGAAGTSLFVASFSQNAPQPSSYPAIERLESRAIAVFVVFEPTPCDKVDFGYDLLEAVSVVTRGTFPDCVFELGQALISRTMDESSLSGPHESVAEEIESGSLLSHVHNARLLWVQRQSSLARPSLQLL